MSDLQHKQITGNALADANKEMHSDLMISA
jgi:hypothetical protein